MTRYFKTLILLIALMHGQQVLAQNSFNYDKDFKEILAKTKDSTSNLSYDKQLIRFQSNDTTLTDYEVLALMIGFTDNPAYKPYQDITTERAIYKLMGEGKFEDGLVLANEYISSHPFSIKVLFEKSYGHFKLGQKDSADYYLYQARELFDAMVFSGSGKSIDNPMFALGPADGQDFIQKQLGKSIGNMGSGADEKGNFIDILHVKENDGSSVPMYFIIQHATNKMFAK